MRTIGPLPVLLFLLMTGSATAGAVAAVWLAWPLLVLAGPFTGVLASAAFALLAYGLAVALYRLVFAITRLPRGDFPPGSRAELLMNLHLLHSLILFQPIMSSRILPVPLLRSFYLALGARMGANTYSGGVIFDPLAIELGANTIIGQGAILAPHVIEGHRLGLYPIRIGSGVTIGAQAVVLADVEIGDGVMVAVGAVVAKGTRIPAGEVWGGVPAKRLRSSRSEDAEPRLRLNVAV